MMARPMTPPLEKNLHLSYNKALYMPTLVIPSSLHENINLAIRHRQTYRQKDL